VVKIGPDRVVATGNKLLAGAIRQQALDFRTIEAVANGSVVSWQHINLLREFDFSDQKQRDSVGITPKKFGCLNGAIIGGAT